VSLAMAHVFQLDKFVRRILGDAVCA